jgi:hypothetical protein
VSSGNANETDVKVIGFYTYEVIVDTVFYRSSKAIHIEVWIVPYGSRR